jgi:hypothetical protein
MATLDSNEKLTAWKAAGFTESKRKPCLHILAGVKCPAAPHFIYGMWVLAKDEICMPRCMDHTSVWNRGGGMAAIVTQPYELDEDDLAEIHALCKTIGVTVEISNKWNWHYEEVMSVVFVKEERR